MRLYHRWRCPWCAAARPAIENVGAEVEPVEATVRPACASDQVRRLAGRADDRDEWPLYPHGAPPARAPLVGPCSASPSRAPRGWHWPPGPAPPRRRPLTPAPPALPAA